MDLQFYPTPTELGTKLAMLIDKPQTPILEPSAGTGNLIEAFIAAKKYKRWHNVNEEDFHCIEKDANRAATLKGKDFKVIYDDFLTFNPLIPYATIIMNPPFNKGSEHLLKALNILADGGELACILNAETIRNPYTNERQTLIRELERQEEYKVEYIQQAFDDTDVEIALIYVKKPARKRDCVTFENFKRLIIDEAKKESSTALIHGEKDYVKHEILAYQAVMKSALHLFDELKAFNGIVKQIGNDVSEVFEVKNRFESARDLAKKVNEAFWKKYLYSDDLARQYRRRDYEGLVQLY